MSEKDKTTVIVREDGERKLFIEIEEVDDEFIEELKRKAEKEDKEKES